MGKQRDDGPGDHDRAGADDGDKVHNGQSQSQQKAVGLTDDKEADEQDEEYPDGEQQLRLQIASEGPQGGGPDLPQKVERPLVQMLSGT